MGSDPVLLIIIPTLNEAGRIEATLRGLQPCRAGGCRVVVCDGGSSDATREAAAPFADQVIVAPRGRASQMNAGAGAGAGDVVLFLHADCRLPEGADRLVLEGLEESGRAWGRFDVAIEGRSALLPVVAAFMNARSRLTGVATGDQAIFVRREAFERVGGFPDIPLMEDVALSKMLRRIDRPLCLRARVVASGRRWESRGTLRTIALMWWLRLAYFLGADPRRLARRYDFERRSS